MKIDTTKENDAMWQMARDIAQPLKDHWKESTPKEENTRDGKELSLDKNQSNLSLLKNRPIMY